MGDCPSQYFSCAPRNGQEGLEQIHSLLQGPQSNPPQNKYLLSIYKQTASVGVVRYNTMHKGTKRDSCPHMHQVKGRQMSVLTVVPAVAPEPALASLSHSPGAPGTTVIDNHPQSRVLTSKSSPYMNDPIGGSPAQH